MENKKVFFTHDVTTVEETHSDFYCGRGIRSITRRQVEE